jgi:hypothetical protein
MSKTLKGMAKQQRDARQVHRQAEDYREMAQKAIENPTPQQREAIRELAEKLGRGPTAGSDRRETPSTGPARPDRPDAATTPVDVRRQPSPGALPHETTIAEWYSNKSVDRGATGPAPADALQQATQGAERAVEQQSIPARYNDLIRGVFRRYSQQVPSPPSTPN